jgi:hypothetical protein
LSESAIHRSEPPACLFAMPTERHIYFQVGWQLPEAAGISQAWSFLKHKPALAYD